jgi:multicomponent K+:H+ antiporter subunit A
MNAETLILIAPRSLLLGAVLQILAARLCSARTKGILAFLACLPAVIAVAATARSVQAGQAIDLNVLHWDGPLALVFHVDALSILFALMGTGLGAFVLLYSIGYMAHDKSATRFYASMLVFIAGFVGLVYSANLFFFYLCWELVGLCSFSLVGFWYTNREAVAGARKVLLMTHIAGYGLLAAILVVYHRTGSALWTDPTVAHAFTGGVFVLMLVALVAKSVQVPLHTWIPEAMAAPTPVSALLHAACYVKAGVYLACRMHSFGAWPTSGGFAWGGAALVWIGTVTMAVGVMYAMVQTDLKRMLAFSTVSQIGYMMMGIGIGTPLAIAAGLLHCLNHGFFKGGLFLTAGSVQHAAGTRDMNKLGGLAQKMPQTTLSWLIGVGSMMGIPLMSGFASKWMLYAAALQAGWAVPAMVAWAVSLGTVFLGVKATSAVFLGPLTDATRDAHESPTTMVWGMGFMAAGSVILGVAPQLAVNYLLNPILGALQMTAVNVTWFGLSADAGSFSTGGGLVLALVSLILGGAIYAIAYASRQVTVGGAALAGAGGGIFTGGEPLSSEGRLTAGDFSSIFLQNWHEFFRWSNVDAAYLRVWSGLQAVSRGLCVVVSWMERRALPLVVALTVVVLVWVKLFASGYIPGTIFDITMPNNLLGLASFCAVAGLALVLASLAYTKSRHLAPWMFLAGTTTVAGLIVTNHWFRFGLLETGALATVVLVWKSARTQAAKMTYLVVVLISFLSLGASELLPFLGQVSHAWQNDWAWVLLITSICVKLAAFPLFFWMLSLADEVPALVLGLIIAVVDMAAFGELILSATSIPGDCYASHMALLGVAAATSFLASILMLTQRSLKRLLVLSTIEDVGFLLLSVFYMDFKLGIWGGIFAAYTHALAKALLFICLSGPEADGALDGEPKGLATRYPVAAFGFLFGMLAMLGIPPTMGFLGRWRLYETALQINPWLAAVFILSSIFALIAYVLALTRIWWGPPREPDPPDPAAQPATKEPLLLQGTIIALTVLLLAAGIWPDALQLLMGGRP